MELTLKYVPADQADASEHYARVSPALRSKRRMMLGALFLVLFVFSSAALRVGDTQSAVVFLILAIAAVLLFRQLTWWIVRRAAIRQLCRNPNWQPDAPVHAVISDDGLTLSSHTSRSIVYWPAILRVETAPEKVFVWLGPESFVLIPRRAVCAGDYDAFLAALLERHADAHRDDGAQKQCAATPSLTT